MFQRINILKHFFYFYPNILSVLVLRLILFIILFTLSGQSVFSQKEIDTKKRHPKLNDKFQFEVGVFFPTKSVEFSANGSTPNDMIDFSETFDFNNNEITPQFGFKWLYSKKWYLSVEYFSIKNSHKLELQEDISFGDIVFKEGSYVKGGFKLNLFRIFTGRSFYKSQKSEFGGGLGIHLLNVGPYIEGEVRINEDETSFEQVNLTTNAPLPNIGIWYYFSPGAKWLINTNLDWFGVNIGEFYVDLWDISAGINYQVLKNMGIYATYRFYKFNAGVNENYWDGRFSFKFNGPAFGLTANF